MTNGIKGCTSTPKQFSRIAIRKHEESVNFWTSPFDPSIAQNPEAVIKSEAAVTYRTASSDFGSFL